MPTSSSLIEQLATLGIQLPSWPEEPEGDNAMGNWIGRGQAYAEGIRLWRAKLRNAPESTKGVVDQLLRHSQDAVELGEWDQLVYAAIKPEVQGSPDYERWQVCTKLIRSSVLTPAQLLGITLELAREQRLAAATYGLRRLLREQSEIDALQRLQLCSELVASSNTSRLMRDANATSVNWDSAVELHEHMARLLVEAVSSEVTTDKSEGGQQMNEMALMSSLDAISSCLGKKGVHGHAEFIALCEEKLPGLLAGWLEQRPWIVEVGCSREIIEGQNSTAQLLALAKRLELSFAGIDLDRTNIEALERDYREFNATWITGKGEQELQTWDKPIAAIYLDAYDFWHASHSELRQKLYRESYGAGINDAKCHTMHLEAARHCTRLIPPSGLLGLDDTWREGEQWAGKGALAVPWLVAQGWKIVSSSNRGVVLLKP